MKTEGWDPQLWLVTFGAAAAHNYSFKKGGAHIIDMMMAKASSDMQDRVMEVAAKASATSAAAFDQGGELFEEKAESQTSLHDIQASRLSAVSLKARGLTAAWSQMHLVELNITKEKRMDVILSQILSTLTAAFLGILVSACVWANAMFDADWREFGQENVSECRVHGTGTYHQLCLRYIERTGRFLLHVEVRISYHLARLALLSGLFGFRAC